MTDWSILLPILPQKPKFGDKCNQCGWCCLTVPCSAARHLTGQEFGACEALGFDGTKTFCGLVRAPEKFIRDIRQAEALVRFVALSNGQPTNLPLGDMIAQSIDISGGCDAIRRVDVDSDISWMESEENKDKIFQQRAASWKGK